MDRDRDTGQYLSCHHERLSSLHQRGLSSSSVNQPGMGGDPSRPKPFAQSGRMVSDFTLTRQRENIAGLEFGWWGMDFSLLVASAGKGLCH
jgi:hypothetical protein